MDLKLILLLSGPPSIGHITLSQFYSFPLPKGKCALKPRKEKEVAPGDPLWGEEGVRPS